VPQPRPRATPSGGAAKASGGAATGGPLAPPRGRRFRCPPAGLHRGGRPRPPTPQRRGGDAAVAAAFAVMGTPVDAAVTAMAAPAAERGGSGAAHPSGGRAAPGARPPRRPPCRGRRRLRRPHGSGGYVSDGGRCTWRQIDGAGTPPPRGSRQPLPPPRPQLSPPPRPRQQPAAACERASCAPSSTAHRRVGGSRGNNAASGGRRRPHSRRAGVVGTDVKTKTAAHSVPTRPPV